MAMDKDILGEALFNVRQVFSNKGMDDLMAEYGTLDNIRMEACKQEADVIINHLNTNAVINVTVATTGTATAQTGTGTGTIS